LKVVFYVERACASPGLYSVGPDWFEYSFVDEEFVNVGYFVNRPYTTRIKCIITLLIHVSALLGHHQVTNVYNYDIKNVPIQQIRCYIIYSDILS
jgi:hypothetical protein